MSDGAYDAALSMLTPKIERGLADPVALDQAATCHWHLQEGVLAMNLMQQIVDSWPQVGAPCVKLASYAASCGERERALRTLQLAFRRGHKTAQSLALLNRVDPIAPKSANARRLKAMAESCHMPNLDRAIARNTLGKIEERAGRFRAAFRWFASANQLHGNAYRPRDVSALVAGQILNFDPQLLPKGAAATEPRMLFITGLPRSGTTVLEHSLSRHPQVRALGESRALSRTVMAMRRRNATAGLWDWFGRLRDADRLAFQRKFLSYLPLNARKDRRVLVFKMPLDCFDIGAAAWLWPKARFLHISRHPLDTGLSNFTTLFHDGHAYSRRLEWIAHMIRAVDRSVDDYTGKLGHALRQQSYRSLVEDPEGQLKAVLKHVELPWEPACLVPEMGTKPVQTASIGQIGFGINTRGLNKWKKYEAQLVPLSKALGADWITQWEEHDYSL